MRDQAVRVVARVVARPGKEDELRALLRGLIEPTRREPGCVTYELLQNTADPTDFTFVEEWSSEVMDTKNLDWKRIKPLIWW